MLGLRDAGEDTPKTLGQAYRLLGILGAFGAHRFYLGHGTSAATMLVITVIGLALLASGTGAAFLALTAGWIALDAALLPRMLRAANHRDVDLTACAEMRAQDRAWH